MYWMNRPPTLVATIADLKQVVAKWKAMGKTVIVAEHRLYYLMDIADRVILHPANFSKITAVSLGNSSIERQNGYAIAWNYRDFHGKQKRPYISKNNICKLKGFSENNHMKYLGCMVQ